MDREDERERHAPCAGKKLLDDPARVLTCGGFVGSKRAVQRLVVVEDEVHGAAAMRPHSTSEGERPGKPTRGRNSGHGMARAEHRSSRVLRRSPEWPARARKPRISREPPKAGDRVPFRGLA